MDEAETKAMIGDPGMAPTPQSEERPPEPSPVLQADGTGVAVGPGHGKGRRWLVPSLALIMVAILVAGMMMSGWTSGEDRGSGASTLLHANLYNYTYEWTYGGSTFEVTVTLNGSDYNSYRSEERTTDYASYVTPGDAVVEALATELLEIADDRGYSDLETAQFVLSFVQSLPYTVDEETTGMAEYCRYPLETLVDQGGDCEDKAVLYASLMESEPLGKDAVLIMLIGQDEVGHMAAGIWARGIPGTYYTYAGRTYYYCETTDEEWVIGEMPSELRGYEITILPC